MQSYDGLCSRELRWFWLLYAYENFANHQNIFKNKTIFFDLNNKIKYTVHQCKCILI